MRIGLNDLKNDFNINDKEHFGCPAAMTKDELRAKVLKNDGKYFD